MEPEEEPCGAAVREVYEEVSSSTEKKNEENTQSHVTDLVIHFVAGTALKQPVKPLMSISGGFSFACLTTDCIHLKLLLTIFQSTLYVLNRFSVFVNASLAPYKNKLSENLELALLSIYLFIFFTVV